MFLQSLPEMLRWLTLFIIGTCLGALINLGIYRLAFFVNRNISPWSPPPSAQRPRTFRDRIPVLGWLFLRRESDVFGNGFWIR
ncbi:MAG: prepilin peptidase, partial [Planctomycetaceae bacterium]|nr:prepilin peptidase [Planctomycetaceae bacterium]